MNSSRSENKQLEPDNSTPAIITDHMYVPRKPQTEPWGLCDQCGLAEAAHKEAAMGYKITAPRAVPEGELEDDTDSYTDR